MSEPRLMLIYGDAYRCEEAVSLRSGAILASDPNTEQHSLFGDEIDPSSLVMELSSASLFSSTRHFVVRRAGKVKQKAFSRIIAEALPPQTYLTFVAVDLKGTSLLVKLARKYGTALALPAFKGRDLTQEAARMIAAQGLRLTPSARKALIDRCKGDLLALREETRKLKTFAPERTLDADDVIRLTFSAGEGSIYPLLDSIMDGDLQEAAKRLASSHDDAGRVFSALIRQITRILMVRTLMDERLNAVKIASVLGLPTWIVRRSIAQAGKHSAQRLAAALDLAIDLDLSVKNGGIRPDDALLKLVLFLTAPLLPAPGHARRSQPSPAGAG